jgi:uncharacterized phiE125 gp8 family phage protein
MQPAVITVCTSAEFESLATLTQLKSLLGITTTDNDDLMTNQLNRATASIETRVGRILRKQTYVEEVPSFGSMYLSVTHTPIQSITSILKDVVDGVEEEVDSTTYRVIQRDSGLIYRQYGWPWTAGQQTDLVATPLAGSENLVYSIEYVGGYEPSTSTSTGLAMPGDLVDATLQTARTWYLGRKNNAAIESKKVGDLSITYKTQESGVNLGAIPEEALSLIEPYVRVL